MVLSDLASYLPTSAHVATLISSISAATAVIAVVVSLRLGHKQRELQLRLALFDKRFAVYRATEEFINVVLRTDGVFNLIDDLCKFQEAIEQANFLFPCDSGVMAYLTEVKEKALRLESEAIEQSSETMELQMYFSDTALKKRELVFAPQLNVSKT